MDAPTTNRWQRSRGGPLALIGRPLLARIDKGLSNGAITVSLPNGGAPERLGGRAAGPEAVVILHSWRALWRLATAGSVGWDEALGGGGGGSPDSGALFVL